MELLRHHMTISQPKYQASVVNRRMPKCNTVLQSESDPFEPEIQPNSHGNCEFLVVLYNLQNRRARTNKGREAVFVSEFLSRSDRDRRDRILYDMLWPSAGATGPVFTGPLFTVGQVQPDHSKSGGAGPVC